MRPKRKTVSAPRNPFIPAMLLLKSGAHGKIEKAKRRADKMELRRQWSSWPGEKISTYPSKSGFSLAVSGWKVSLGKCIRYFHRRKYHMAITKPVRG